MEDSILEVSQLSFTYEDGTKALDNISFQIKKGEKVALLGANGSGKSTLFLTLTGIHKPQSGSIFLHGLPVSYSKKGLFRLRSQIGMIFQEPDQQIFSPDVFQEIAFGPSNLGFHEDTVKKKVAKIIEELNMEAYLSKPTHLLSGGQKKQVAIADVLVMEPEIILLDEPASSLDPFHTRLVYSLIDRMAKQKITLFLSTHDMDHALSFADRIILFDHGKIAADGRPEDIFLEDALLKETNLEPPALLRIFLLLKAKGVLEKNCPVPKSYEELENLF